MNEGYALFDKVVGVLENANAYQRVTGSKPFPSTNQEVTLCTITFDSPGIYLVLTYTEAVLNSLYNNLTNFSNVIKLGGSATRANVWGGGGLSGWFLVSAEGGGTASLIGYYSQSFDSDEGHEKIYNGEIVAIKLLGGGVLRNLITRPRRAVVA